MKTLLICLSLLIVNNFTFASSYKYINKEPSLKYAVQTATRDAEYDSNKGSWFLGSAGAAMVGSCILGSVSVITAYNYVQPPPLYRLIGKNPEYISLYTQIYLAKKQTKQTTFAFLGCTIGIIANLLILTSDK